ncbi:MAG: IS30 family transposase [Burkholderiales bacterium]|nr:IS30 family transposase [Burkholderiales bacterium]
MTKASQYQQLQSDERIALAQYREQGMGMRAIARMLHRSPSTISREIERNAPIAAYSGTFAQQRCMRRRKQCRPAPKLTHSGALFVQVCGLLKRKWSPQQIALHLARQSPLDGSQRVSHETIYNAIYAQPRGELRKDLIACLRYARSKRMPRTRGTDRRARIADMISIHMRPPEVNDRLFPGHWEGDLIKGRANASAVGTLVERSSRLLILVHLPHPKPASAANVLQAFTDKLRSIALPMRQSMTYDQGSEMARHKELSANANIAVYFCDPHSPWQRGTNENTNGLVRQYLPKGMDLSDVSQQQLDAIADEINNRPRKTLNAHSPIEVYREFLLKHHPQHATIQ